MSTHHHLIAQQLSSPFRKNKRNSVQFDSVTKKIAIIWKKMPPRKAKLHSSTGKLKTINKAYTLPSGSPPSSATSSTSNTNRSNDTAAPRSQAGSNAVTQTNMQHSVTTEVPEINDRVVSIASHDTEADQQFELELCWCIQTLEKSLEASNLSAKQGRHRNAIHIT